MTTTVPVALPGTLDTRDLRRVVAALCLTEIVSYGVLYYAFTVLNGQIVADTGWPVVATMFAFSLGQVVAAVGGIAVGRIIDRRGPRLVMTLGSVVAVPAVMVIALAPNEVVFVGGWALAGLAMAAVLYTPAFSAITHWGGTRAVEGLTTVTLVAGLASTVFGPLAAWLAGSLGWRGSFLVLGGILALLTVPAHWVGLRGEWIPRPRHESNRPSRGLGLSRPFVMLALVMSMVVLVEYGVLVQLVPMLVARGLSVGEAALVLGVGGAGQVAGRLLYVRVAKLTSVVQRSSGLFLLLAVTTVLFVVVPPRLGLLLLVTVVAGAARGCVTLLLATAIPDRWGSASIGRYNGLLAAPVMLTGAVAPFIGALLLAQTSAPVVFVALAAVAVLAAVLVPLTMPRAMLKTA